MIKEIAVETKQDDGLTVQQKVISSFDKIYVIIVCCEDMYGAAAS